MKILVILAVMVIAASVQAEETYVKVDDSTIRHIVSEIKDTTQDYTLSELTHEIEGCTNDLARLEEQAAKTRAPIEERKAKLEAVLAEANTLGIIEPIEEPIELEEPI